MKVFWDILIQTTFGRLVHSFYRVHITCHATITPDIELRETYHWTARLWASGHGHGFDFAEEAALDGLVAATSLYIQESRGLWGSADPYRL